MPSKLGIIRRRFHERLQATVWGLRSGIPTNADKENPQSVAIAQRFAEELAKELGFRLQERQIHANTLGKGFADSVAEFLRESLPLIERFRPGPFEVTTKGASDGIAAYAQYLHLRQIREVLDRHPSLRSTLGSDYLVRPDIVVSRACVAREDLGAGLWAPDDPPGLALRSSLLQRPQGAPLLFASVSAKWTIRSDRAQNTRTEALNLIRYRKGGLPHVVAVTFEPLASRLASIAEGTGDVDCVYHGALPELAVATRQVSEDAAEVLGNLIDGDRLRDISDLPLDLAA